MALVALRGKFIYMPFLQDFAATGTAVTTTFNGAADALAVILKPETTTIDKVAFRIETFTTGGDVEVAVFAVSATTGLPTGAALGSTATSTIAATGVVSVTGVNTTGLTLTTDYAVVITAAAGFAGSFTVRIGEGTGSTSFYPYVCLNTAGTFSKSITTGTGIAVGVGDATNFWNIPGLLGPYDLVTTAAVTSGSDPREVANIFNLPFAATLWGAAVRVGLVGAGADFSLNAYATPTGTPSSSASLSQDDDITGTTGSRLNLFRLSAEVDWSINTDYAIGLQSSGADGVTTMRADFGAQEQMDAFLSKNVTAAVRATTGATSFTADTDSCHTIFPIFSKLSDNVSSGGGGGQRVIGS